MVQGRLWGRLLGVGLLLGAIWLVGAAQKRPARPAAVPAPKLAAPASWLQWGGPTRDFNVASPALNTNWPASGPKQLWSRSLGEGHSAILAESGRLYTMYSAGDREVIVALDAASGRTLWEFGYGAPRKGLNLGEGPGPHSTPLIVGNLLYAVGMKGTMHALEKTTGKLVWKHELWGEFNGHFVDRGYAPSPLAYRNTVIVPVGGGDGNQCLMAFEQQSGAVAWRNVSFKPSPASPVVINVGGQDQLVHFGANEVYGADPTSGALLWSHPHKTDYGLNISTPVWNPANGMLFISSAYGTGAKGLQLTRNGSQTAVRQVWANTRMRVHFGTAIRIDDLVYGSSGDFGPAFFTAINIKNGQIAWQDRALARASFLYADNKFVILDEDGTLALATPGPSGLQILARAAVAKSRAWTVPTLAGTRLFLRDRHSIMAVELGS